MDSQAAPAAVGELMRRAPYCLNIRESAMGDTLLHYCANTGKTTLAAACLGSVAAVFVPKFPGLPEELVGLVVTYWAHVGFY